MAIDLLQHEKIHTVLKKKKQQQDTHHNSWRTVNIDVMILKLNLSLHNHQDQRYFIKFGARSKFCSRSFLRSSPWTCSWRTNCHKIALLRNLVPSTWCCGLGVSDRFMITIHQWSETQDCASAPLFIFTSSIQLFFVSWNKNSSYRFENMENIKRNKPAYLLIISIQELQKYLKK